MSAQGACFRLLKAAFILFDPAINQIYRLRAAALIYIVKEQIFLLKILGNGIGGFAEQAVDAIMGDDGR